MIVTAKRLLFLSLLITSLWAQTKPNFSGTWKLNVAESDFSDKRAAVPDRMVWTLEQKGDHVAYKVEVERQGKKNGFDLDADIGGAPFESDDAGIVSFQWKGLGLVVDTLYNPGTDRQSSMQEIWTLSFDGKKLSDEVVYHMPKTAKNPADVHFKRVFDRQ